MPMPTLNVCVQVYMNKKTQHLLKLQLYTYIYIYICNWNWSSCSKLALRASLTHGLIAHTYIAYLKGIYLY